MDFSLLSKMLGLDQEASAAGPADIAGALSLMQVPTKQPAAKVAPKQTVAKVLPKVAAQVAKPVVAKPATKKGPLEAQAVSSAPIDAEALSQPDPFYQDFTKKLKDRYTQSSSEFRKSGPGVLGPDEATTAMANTAFAQEQMRKAVDEGSLTKIAAAQLMQEIANLDKVQRSPSGGADFTPFLQTIDRAFGTKASAGYKYSDPEEKIKDRIANYLKTAQQGDTGAMANMIKLFGAQMRKPNESFTIGTKSQQELDIERMKAQAAANRGDSKKGWESKNEQKFAELIEPTFTAKNNLTEFKELLRKDPLTITALTLMSQPGKVREAAISGGAVPEGLGRAMQKAEMIAADYIKSISGKAVSDTERKNLREGVIGLAQLGSPDKFVNGIENLVGAIIQSRYIIAEGGFDERTKNTVYGRIGVKGMPKIGSERTQEPATNIDAEKKRKKAAFDKLIGG